MRAIVVVALILSSAGCSVKRIAVNKLGNALASGGSSYESDDDPDLVADALPFSLKLIESLLAESPQHKGMLLAAASGFTQYGRAFVEQRSDEAQKDIWIRVNACGRGRGASMRGRTDTACAGWRRAIRASPRQLKTTPKRR